MKRTMLVLATAVAALTLPAATAAMRLDTPAAAASQVLLDWNTIGVNTMLKAPTFQSEGFIYMSYTQAAVYDAITAIKGGYRPLLVKVKAPAGASSDAAAAAAAHAILVHFFPAQAQTLDAAYASTLAAISGGSSNPGVAVGEQAARAVIGKRESDGLNGSISWYSLPTAGAGMWSVPTVDNVAARTATPQTPWVAKVTPFVLKRASQFRPAAPESLSSAQWVADYNEVKAFGGQDPARTSRTADQATVARFWTANNIAQYNNTLRAIAALRNLGPEQTARLLAMGNVVVTDAAIACFDAKYAYSFWRPIQAIRGDDGNPATTPDSNWKPFLAPTPNHAEYPSAHGCVTSAFGAALAKFLGSSRVNIDIAGVNPASKVFEPGYTRHFDRVADLNAEIVNARVWAGYHYRTSVEVGLKLGTQVARYDLARAFRRSR